MCVLALWALIGRKKIIHHYVADFTLLLWLILYIYLCHKSSEVTYLPPTYALLIVMSLHFLLSLNLTIFCGLQQKMQRKRSGIINIIIGFVRGTIAVITMDANINHTTYASIKNIIPWEVLIIFILSTLLNLSLGCILFCSYEDIYEE